MQGTFKVGMILLASGQAGVGMVLPPFLLKQLYHSDSVITASVVETETTR